MPKPPLWEYSVSTPITTSPAQGPDGTVYVGNSTGLFAITNGGSNKWTFAATVKGSPAIGHDGTVYFGAYEGTFYALSPSGSLKWSFAPQGYVWSTPALAADGTIYYVAGGALMALNPDGSKKWQLGVSGGTTPVQGFSPVVGRDGTIYCGSAFRNLIAVSPQGDLKWSVPIDGASSDSPAIGADGTVYVAGANLFAIASGGGIAWGTSTNDFGSASPAVGRNGTIYVESLPASSPGLHALSPSGTLLWRSGSSPGAYGYPMTCPAVDVAGNLYFASSNTLFAIAPQGTVQWVFSPTVPSTPPPPDQSSPIIGPDGTIYVAFYCTLYAISGTNAPADAPWPMYRQNARHTGRADKPALAKPQKRADANFQFQLYGTVGNTNTVQASTDLANWTSLTDIVVTNVPMDFVDYSASNFVARFYRTIQQ